MTTTERELGKRAAISRRRRFESEGGGKGINKRGWLDFLDRSAILYGHFTLPSLRALAARLSCPSL